MKVTGVICEYNPLHLGHIFHLDRARRETGADHIIAVMSGDYVQRGGPAIISKYERALHALMAGADLVLELPIYYSTGSLEYFSRGSVSLLKETGLVDCISFGSECGNISLLNKAARLTSSLTVQMSDQLKDLLAKGVSYSDAYNSVTDLPDEISDLIRTPNNLLATAYIRAAWDLSFDCEFHTVKRSGADYHDGSLGALSSTSIRNDLISLRDSYPEASRLKNGLHNVINQRMPADIEASLVKYLKKLPPLTEDDFSLLLFYKLQSLIENSASAKEAAAELSSYLDVSGSLAHKIIKYYRHAASFTLLCEEIKSKDINYARISRALLHILLDIKKDDADKYVSSGYNYYFKPLGFRKDAGDLLHAIKKTSSLSIISRNADGKNIEMYSHGMRATDLYNKTACSKYGRPFISELEQSPVVL